MNDDDITEEQWLESIARHCDCCPHCSDVPCPGVQAGGMCDDALCSCDDDDGFMDDSEDEYEDDLP